MSSVDAVGAVKVYLPDKKEINVPNKPSAAIPIIRRPMGTFPVVAMGASAGNVGNTSGGGSVKVGSRVGGISTKN
jgi:hypothetical protein